MGLIDEKNESWKSRDTALLTVRQIFVQTNLNNLSIKYVQYSDKKVTDHNKEETGCKVL
jgi:hypothetical protein